MKTLHIALLALLGTGIGVRAADVADLTSPYAKHWSYSLVERPPETDDFGLGVVKDQVHVHDLQATILHLLGFNHEKLTYRFQGRDYRLTDVHGKPVRGVIA